MEEYETISDALLRIEKKIVENEIRNRDKVITLGELADLKIPEIKGSVYEKIIDTLTDYIVQQLNNCQPTTRVSG